jgi:hypothetical protein
MLEDNSWTLGFGLDFVVPVPQYTVVSARMMTRMMMMVELAASRWDIAVVVAVFGQSLIHLPSHDNKCGYP